jgi:hypothetical protein
MWLRYEGYQAMAIASNRLIARSSLRPFALSQPHFYDFSLRRTEARCVRCIHARDQNQRLAEAVSLGTELQLEGDGDGDGGKGTYIRFEGLVGENESKVA